MSQLMIYLKPEQSVCVNHRKVILEDIATVYCSNPEITTNVKKIRLHTFPNEKNSREAISLMKIVEEIKKLYKEAEVTNLGERDTIIYYKQPGHNRKWLTWLKVLLVCLTCFFGAAISIMGYNNDIGLTEVFGKIYYLTMGVENAQGTIIHFFYAVGLFAGMIVFFNHASKKRLSDEPTPVEVQMRVYEQDVNKAIVIGSSRKEEELDVDS